MPSALIDTTVLLDYLQGDRRAERAMRAYDHRSISVVTWLELLSISPEEVIEPTRGFLRTFERLSVSESIADDALRLIQERPGLCLSRAQTWATARVNQLSYVTADPRHVRKADVHVIVPYRWTAERQAQYARSHTAEVASLAPALR